MRWFVMVMMAGLLAAEEEAFWPGQTEVVSKQAPSAESERTPCESSPAPARRKAGLGWSLRYDSATRVSTRMTYYSALQRRTSSWHGWSSIVEADLGLAGGGINIGYGFAEGGIFGSRHLLGKLGLLRTWGEPFGLAENEWFGYAGVELGARRLLLPLVLEGGVLVGEDDQVARLSLGIGF